MEPHTLDGHLGRPVTVDLCDPCQAIWFDQRESLQLTPGATLSLFRLIGERIAKPGNGQRVRGTLKLDLLVAGCVVVELKAVEAIHPIHLAQVMTYLKLTGYPAGLLMNFNVTSLRAGLRRLEHPDRYLKSQESKSPGE